jgi:hypothetical protein
MQTAVGRMRMMNWRRHPGPGRGRRNGGGYGGSCALMWCGPHTPCEAGVGATWVGSGTSTGGEAPRMTPAMATMAVRSRPEGTAACRLRMLLRTRSERLRRSCQPAKKIITGAWTCLATVLVCGSESHRPRQRQQHRPSAVYEVY